ncbi:hypothetical protein Dda3937_03857 [Dickeya dadantii 3937]|uniref:Uncharacterized protein n=1 Tax=Dickeya dadantii (strain 3937) TaxID=198628 RepID=E0SBG6_DICD3|nr:hypothetical protein Dda3937_03857 [Dickeya dadantii 3937]
MIVIDISLANILIQLFTDFVAQYFDYQFFVSKSIIPISPTILIKNNYHQSLFDRW